jgi:hypothetical protein
MVSPAEKETFNFNVISGDPDSYTLGFAISGSHNSLTFYNILVDAIHYRVQQIVTRNALTVQGLRSTVDLFDSSHDGYGYVEIDIMNVSRTAISFELYLYNTGNELKGKAYCSLYFENTARTPEL